MANRFVAAASLPLSLSNNLGYVIATKMLIKKHMNKNHSNVRVVNFG